MNAARRAGADQELLMAWTRRLIDAVNADNETDPRCDAAASHRILAAHPQELRQGAALALADFALAGPAPLTGLRSDSVAQHFTTQVAPAVNLLVARLTVPGGPWPGHFGLEAILFRASQACMPEWFPPTPMPFPLHFCEVLAATNGFLKGQGGVMFPELLSRTEPIDRQVFGLVFIDRLTGLYLQRVVPVRNAVNLRAEDLGGDPAILRRRRQVAFMAHEWGHLTEPMPYGLTVRASRRPMAIIGELHADLAAIDMLARHSTDEAMATADCLVLDRIAREAWLPRARSQVNSVAARQLLLLLREGGAFQPIGDGYELRLDKALPRLRDELGIVKAMESASSRGPGSAEDYLSKQGWVLSDNRYHLELSDDLSTRLSTASASL
jgi:hypothetical protein